MATGSKDIATRIVTSGYKWLTQTLYAAQQAFNTRPFFSVKVTDDQIVPNQRISTTIPAQGSMDVGPDGTLFAVGVVSGELRLYRATNFHTSGWDSFTVLDTSGDEAIVGSNIFSMAISDWYQGTYRIDVFYFSNFSNGSGTGFLRKKLQMSLNKGFTWDKRNFGDTTIPYNTTQNLGLTTMKPVYKNHYPDGWGLSNGCFFLAPNPNNSSYYDVMYDYAPTTSGWATNKSWGRVVNSNDWIIHSLSTFYHNGYHHLVFSGYRNAIETPGPNANYSLWVTKLINILSNPTADLWAPPTAILPIGAASELNENSFTYPWARKYGDLIYVTAKATLTDTVFQSSKGTGSDVFIVETHTNYILLNSDDGVGFSYPSNMYGEDGSEFNSGWYASFVPQGAYWNMQNASDAKMWEYIQDNEVADLSSDTINYEINEQMGQPSSVAVKIANEQDKWYGNSPSGPGFDAIKKNRKVSIWQGYYNASGAPETVPHSYHLIDDIVQLVTSSKNELTIAARDIYKKLKTTITRFTYQFQGPVFFSDNFEGSNIFRWNQVSGIWTFTSTINPPRLILTYGPGSEDSIQLIGSNGESYGHRMRIFVKAPGGGYALIYGFYIDENNWLRLEVRADSAADTEWAVIRNVAGTKTTMDSGTMPFDFDDDGVTRYFGFYVLRYDYFKFAFMINDATSSVGNEIHAYAPATVSFLFKNSGNGEYDMGAYFASNPSWRKQFTCGFGRKAGTEGSGPTDFEFFSYSRFNDPNSLGTLFRRVARISGIFSFKDTYYQEYPLSNLIPFNAGTYTISRRQVVLTASNFVRSSSDFTNGEITFKAKVTPSAYDNANGYGFKFTFRYIANGTNGQPDQYQFHIRQGVGGLGNFSLSPTYSRFERKVDGLSNTYIFYNSTVDVSNNPTGWLSASLSINSLAIQLKEWNDFRIVMIDGWMYAFVNDIMVAAWVDNNNSINPLTTGKWGFEADAVSTVYVKDIKFSNFWKPIENFTFNAGDDAEGAIMSLFAQLRAFMFTDLLGRLKVILLNSTDPSTYTYNEQLIQQKTNESDKEYVTQVTVYGSNIIATARNTVIQPGAIMREAVIVDYQITTYADALTRAQNELTNANQYLNQYTPQQVINVGAELFDVVTIVNTGENTTGVNGATRVYGQAFQEGGGGNNSDYFLEIATGDV